MGNDTIYEQKLAQEAEVWGAESERMARVVPPDWRYLRRLRQNAIMRTADIDALLNRIQPHMNVLELGCAAGWLTLAMAQRGAQATGMDLSEKSLSVARAYYESIRADAPCAVTYETCDLNHLELPPETYDVVVAKGVLHHLIRLDHTIEQIWRSLKPGGLLWVSDTLGEEATTTVLIAGALTFALPTATSYRDKIRALLKFGLRAPSRVKASIEAQGLSPFEGAGRDQNWYTLVARRFTIERRVDHPAFTGYVTAQLNAPDWFALPLLKTLYGIDRLLVRLKVLKNTGVVVYARKTQQP